MTYEFGDNVFEREFDATDSNGNKSIIKLRIGTPYLEQNSMIGLKWRCPYQIIGKGSEKIKFAPGIDAIDAIIMSLRLADVFLKNYQKDTKITWLDDDDLGLIPPQVEATENPTQASDDERDELFDEMFPSEDENSPFKKVFDEFFRNFKSVHRSE